MLTDNRCVLIFLLCCFRPTDEDEVSVYDVKDHMEYNFRPGQVAVRIGCYDSAAAAQVSRCVKGSLDEKIRGLSHELMIQS